MLIINCGWKGTVPMNPDESGQSLTSVSFPILSINKSCAKNFDYITIFLTIYINH